MANPVFTYELVGADPGAGVTRLPATGNWGFRVYSNGNTSADGFRAFFYDRPGDFWGPLVGAGGLVNDVEWESGVVSVSSLSGTGEAGDPWIWDSGRPYPDDSNDQLWVIQFYENTGVVSTSSAFFQLCLGRQLAAVAVEPPAQDSSSSGPLANALRSAADVLFDTLGASVPITLYPYTRSAPAGLGSVRTAGDAITTTAVVDSSNSARVDGFEMGDDLLFIRGSELGEDQIGLSWGVSIDGAVERPVNGPIVRYQVGSGQPVVYLAHVKTGGGSRG